MDLFQIEYNILKYIYKYININIYIDGADHKKQSMWWDAKQGLHGVECHNVNQVR